MYRDDLCAVCGDSLPPDHLYCREHAAVVDTLLHDIGSNLPALLPRLREAADLVERIHPDTWDFVAEEDGQDDDVIWPGRPTLRVTTDGEDFDVDVDSEPGRVTVEVQLDLVDLLRAVATALEEADVAALSAAARSVEGAGATH